MARPLALLLVLAGALAQDQYYAPPAYSPPQQSFAPQQWARSDPTTSPAFQPQELQAGYDHPDPKVIAAGEWKIVPNDFSYDNGPLFPQMNLPAVPTAVKIALGLAFVLGLLGLVFYLLQENPAMKKAIAALEEHLPKEGRSLDTMLPLMQEAFNAIDKYALLNRD